MTTSTTDAEAIAREAQNIARRAYVHADDNAADIKRNFAHIQASANAILSYLASRREAQEPVAWRYRWYGGIWRVQKNKPHWASSTPPANVEIEPLYTAPPSPAPAGEVERLRCALEIIAGERQCLDNLMSNADVARAALNGGREKGK